MKRFRTKKTVQDLVNFNMLQTYITPANFFLENKIIISACLLIFPTGVYKENYSSVNKSLFSKKTDNKIKRSINGLENVLSNGLTPSYYIISKLRPVLKFNLLSYSYSMANESKNLITNPSIL